VSDAGELLTLSESEAIIWHGAESTRYDGLAPGTEVDLDGHVVTTLPARGELLCTIATVNDVHFGETEAGRYAKHQDLPTFRVGKGETPYPLVMNQAAVHDIGGRSPDLLVAKGDLTSKGRMSEYEAFLDCYSPFGDRLMHVRGNHESYNHLEVACDPWQERKLEGVTVALLDTSRDGKVNGILTGDQLDWLDELGSRSDQPVLVFGHHPAWDSESDPHSDETYGLLPDCTEHLAGIFRRRPTLTAYFAGHTHRNKVIHIEGLEGVPFGEVSCVKDFPGSWAEYRVFEGNINAVHRRIEGDEALRWTEKTRGMYGGTYTSYASGALTDRCFEIPIRPPARR
jgi:3',5'-cyclic AMP phosphodiesterase CpdA